MNGNVPQDKTSFQVRRVLENERISQNPPKKRFDVKKYLQLKRTFFKKFFLRLPFFQSKKRVIITTVILGIFLVAGSAFGYYEYLLSQDPAVIYAKKLNSMTQVVGQQVSLPTNEQPVVATVSDISKLPHEAFFKNAQDGDKILMYKKDKKAILYRPSIGKVITVATLDFENVTPTPAQRAVAGASTSALLSQATPTPASAAAQYVPQGKILIQPQQ